MITNSVKKRLFKYVLENVENISTLNEVCNTILKEEQQRIMLNPTVYIARTTDKDGNTYLNAKTFFPISLTKNKDLRVYVGKISDFPNGTKDKDAKIIGERKIKELIKRLIENNEL